MYINVHFVIGIGGGGGGGFGFINIPNTFFSFINCSMHKTHSKMLEMTLKKTLFFKISRRACRRPPRGSRAFGGPIRADSCPPPKNF